MDEAGKERERDRQVLAQAYRDAAVVRGRARAEATRLRTIAYYRDDIVGWLRHDKGTRR